MRRCFSKNIMTCKEEQSCFSYSVSATAKVKNDGETTLQSSALSLKSWFCGDKNSEIDVKTCDLFRSGLQESFAKEKGYTISDLRTSCGDIKECKGGCVAEELISSGRFKIKPEMGNRKGKGKCRNAMYSSFQDEPDDQESFTFSDDSNSETNTTARMFSMAVLDGSKVVSNGTGFEGPNVVTEETTSGSGKTAKKTIKTYITITVDKFEKKMVYDPTVDMDSTGGTNGDIENKSEEVEEKEKEDDKKGSGRASSASVLLLSMAVSLLLRRYA